MRSVLCNSSKMLILNNVVLSLFVQNLLLYSDYNNFNLHLNPDFAAQKIVHETLFLEFGFVAVLFFFCVSTNQPCLLEAEIFFFCHYYVIENSESEDLSCFGKLLMGFCVGFAWLGVA